MKVLFVCLGNVWAGGEIYSKYLMEYYAELGILSGCFSSRLEHRASSENFTQISRNFSDYKYSAKLINTFIKKGNVDVVHFSGYRAIYLSHLLNKHDGVKYIATKHLPFQDRASFNIGCEVKKIISPFIFKSMDKLICVSAAEKSDYPRRLMDKAVFIPNGTPKVDISSECKKSETSFNFLYFARLEKHKGLNDLLIAFKNLSERHKHDIKLYVAGKGSLESYLLKFLGLNPTLNIEYLGFVSDKPPVLINADCLVLPSSKEGMPLNIIEAMSVGIPTVAYDIDGVNEVVRDDINGWLCAHGDVAVLESKMLLAVADKVAYRKKSMESLLLYEKYHTIRDMAESTIEAYKAD
ncbi:MAG: glycosyltransferase involved in cell wall biosynthesis [Bermanella sp.]|jgi:glycosyltransferase involved in cell wall biosynthesis